MSTKLVYGRYLAADAGQVIPWGAVLVRGDEIVEVGTYEGLRNHSAADEVIGSADHLVTPGFVNAHGHGRGLTDFQLGTKDNTLETWKFRSYPPLDPYADTLWGAIRLLESGVTTTMHVHNLVRPDRYEEEFRRTLQGYLDSGLRVAFAPTLKNQNFFIYGDNDAFLRSLPPALRAAVTPYAEGDARFGDQEYFAAVKKLRKEFESPRVKIMHGPLSPQWCRDDSLMEVKRSANELGMRIHIHVLQTILQKKFGIRKYGKSLLEHLHDLRFLGENVTCGHSVWLTPKDMDLLAETGASVTTHASCNLRIRNGICPVFDLLQRGVRVGIGLDDKGFSDDKDFVEEMRVVSNLQKISALGLESAHLQPADCFRMGTLHGAEVLGYGGITGALAQGKKADLVLFDLTRITEPFLHPRQNIIDALIYRGKSSDVDTVMVGGEVLVRKGRFTRLERQEVIRSLLEPIPPDDPAEVVIKRQMFDELKKHIVRYYANWRTETGPR